MNKGPVGLITVVGSGMVAPRDLTLGGAAAIQRADAVVYSAPWPGISDWLDGLGARRVIDISRLYVENAVDSDNYDSIIGELYKMLGEAADLVYVVPGNPTLGVTTTSVLVDDSRRFPGLEVIVLPGVSSLDTISVDLQVDYLDRGTVAVDANRLLMYEIKLDPTLGTVIYHPGSVGTTRVDFKSPWESNRLHLLQDYLLRTHVPSHPYRIVLCASAPGRDPEILSGTLGQLAADVRRIEYGSSLYIPPAANFSFDAAFVESLRATTLVEEDPAGRG